MRAWIMRGLLACLLLFASEIWLWTDPPGRAPLSWVLLLVGYLALSAVLLDFAARYRIRDGYALLALAGIFGLLNGLLLNPETALADVPRTWATRVLGAYTLLGLAALLLLLALRRHGSARWLWLFSALSGLLWGVWVQGLPSFTTIAVAVPSLPMLLTTGGTVLLIAVGSTWLAGRFPAAPRNLRLNLLEWLIVVAGLASQWVIHRTQIDLISLAVLSGLLVYCWLLLWFEKRDQTALLDTVMPLQPVAALRLLVVVVILLAAGGVGYSLPLVDVGLPGLIVGLFAAFGLVWLPTVSLVLGVRSYRSLGRRQRL